MERLEDVAGPPQATTPPGPAASPTPAPESRGSARDEATGRTTDRASDRPSDSGRDDADGPHDLALFIPERLANAIERRRAAWSPVDTLAAWLVGLHLILLAVIVGRGSFYVDDLRAQGYAVQQPFWHFIVGSNGTHFAPIPRVLDWAQSRYVPLQHAPAVLITLLVRLLLALGFWRVLRRLFGPRPAALVPLALLLFTPALIPATTWYRQSITIVACTVAIVWAIDAHLRWVLYRHWADLLVLVAVTAIGLGCYEKAAMIPVILLGLTLAIFTSRRGLRSTGTQRSATLSGLVGVLASAIVVLVFLVIYRSGPYDQGSGSVPTPLDVLKLSGGTATHTVIPLLLGGPYHWFTSAPYSGDPRLSQTAVAFSLVLALASLAVAGRRRPAQTARALVLLLAWTLPSVAIVAAGRFVLYQMALQNVARFWSDLVPAFLLVGALAFLPWRVGVRRSEVRPTAPRRPASGPAVGPAIAPVEIGVSLIAAGLVMLIVLGGSVLSSLTYASNWWENPTGRWITNARATLVNAEPYPRMVATPLPNSIMPYWVAPTFPTDAPLLLLLRPDTRFYDGDGDAKVMNASGLRSPYVPKTLVQTKQTKLCVAALAPGTVGPVAIPLPRATPYTVGSQVEVGLLLAESTKVEVTVVTPDGKVLTPQRFSDVELPQGPHTLRFPVPFGKTISGIQVQIQATKISCVAFGRIWVPVT